MSFEALLSHADKVVEGPDLNRVLYETRLTIRDAVGYEMVLDGRTFESFLEVELPKLTEHFLAKRLPMLGGPNVLLTLWHSDRAHIFSGSALITGLLTTLELEEEQLKEHIRNARTARGLSADPWATGDPTSRIEALLPARKK